MPHWIVSPGIFWSTSRTIRRKSNHDFRLIPHFVQRRFLDHGQYLVPTQSAESFAGAGSLGTSLHGNVPPSPAGQSIGRQQSVLFCLTLVSVIYQDHLVTVQDWSALLDTSGALVRVAAVLIAVTALLQLGAAVLAGDPRSSNS